jgi:insertion element IS1 protein InsB
LNWCISIVSFASTAKKFINCSFGSRGTETGKLLWEKLKKKEIGEVMTDH